MYRNQAYHYAICLGRVSFERTDSQGHEKRASNVSCRHFQSARQPSSNGDAGMQLDHHPLRQHQLEPRRLRADSHRKPASLQGRLVVEPDEAEIRTAREREEQRSEAIAAQTRTIAHERTTHVFSVKVLVMVC